jgi:hypothetical protein
MSPVINLQLFTARIINATSIYANDIKDDVRSTVEERRLSAALSGQE